MRYDIVISGGGLVGAVLAGKLARAGFSVMMVDRAALDQPIPDDGRSSALSLGSRFILDECGVWEALSKHAGPISHIRIVDQDSPQFIHYDHLDVSREPMGYIVQNRDLHKAACALLSENSGLVIRAPDQILSAHIQPHRVELSLKSGEMVHASLLVIAEGKFSSLRDQLGFSMVVRDYHQTGITCNVRHEMPHYEVAHERFLQHGPFAILPMKDPHHSSIVWTEITEFAARLMQLSDEEFMEQLGRRFGDFLGTLSLASVRRSYPFKLSYPKKITSSRVVLVGDSAHAIHPISGQGLNLGLSDVKALAAKLSAQRAVGLDIGSASMLSDYEHSRYGEIRAMMLVTDGINQLFRTSHPLFAIPRRLGMSVVQHTPVLKKFFMRHAMGIN